MPQRAQDVECATHLSQRQRVVHPGLVADLIEGRFELLLALNLLGEVHTRLRDDPVRLVHLLLQLVLLVPRDVLRAVLGALGPAVLLELLLARDGRLRPGGFLEQRGGALLGACAPLPASRVGAT